MAQRCIHRHIHADLTAPPLPPRPTQQVREKVNTYTTTLHAINSAVIKISKLTVAHSVYRGISGMKLPDTFKNANEFGVRGGIESAFMSTTANREVALAYAANRDQGLLFELQQGMIDRGADISFLSQYPHEKEMCAPRILLVMISHLNEPFVQIEHVEPSTRCRAQ